MFQIDDLFCQGVDKSAFGYLYSHERVELLPVLFGRFMSVIFFSSGLPTERRRGKSLGNDAALCQTTKYYLAGSLLSFFEAIFAENDGIGAFWVYLGFILSERITYERNQSG